MAKTLEMSSIEVPGTARPDLGLGGIRRCARPVGPKLSVDGKRTLFEVFQDSAFTYPNNACLGYRPIKKNGEAGDYVWQTYDQIYKRALQFGSGLVHLDLCPTNDEGYNMLGFYSKNKVEYFIADIASYSQSIVPVPCYDSYKPADLLYVADQTELKTVVCSSDLLSNVLEVNAQNSSLLTTAILIDGEFCTKEKIAELKQAGEQQGCKVYTFQEIEAIGQQNPKLLKLPASNDLAFLCYTSGTTGNPKGGMIAHSGMISSVSSFKEYDLDVYPTDVHLSYLPLPHVFERAISTAILQGGGRVGVYQGDTTKILEDIQALKPTMFPSVPRLLNRVHDKLIAGVEEAGGLKKWLFETALASKKANLKNGVYTHPIWDRLVFKGVKEKVGFGNLRIMMSGSAPLSTEVMMFLRAVFGVVTEGYGQTESSLLISFTEQYDSSIGHVGLPAPCNEVRLVDVPDMGYKCTDTEHQGVPVLGRGEIVFRGPNVFMGYYKMPEKTAETIDKDGWCHTGDIGAWTADGKLRIIDRLKSILKLSQGEYVAVAKVENTVSRSPWVLQSYVYGDSLESCLVAIVTPDPEMLESKGLQANDPKVKEAMFNSIVEECKKAKLNGFEIPKAIYVDDTTFEEPKPAANGLPARPALLTPTFKLKSAIAKKFYKEDTSIVDDLYSEIKSRSKL